MNEQELKQHFITWLDVTFIDEEDSVALATAKKLINKQSNTWVVLTGFTREDWKDLVGSIEVGIRIYNYLHPQQGSCNELSSRYLLNIYILEQVVIDSYDDVVVFLNKLCGHQVDLSAVVSLRKSLISLQPIQDDNVQIEELPPYMLFASREIESTQLLECLQKQINTNFSAYLEPLKRVVVPTVAGTAGKGT